MCALFLETDDFARDHAAMLAAGVSFGRGAPAESYGIVAVWRTLSANCWDPAAA
ncbi:MAG: hypothetical protein R3D46_12340 [Defluviimonas denitrificans]